MRILIHCVYYPPEVGGLESHVHHLARGLVEAGHGVDVVTSRSREGLPAREEREGVRIWRTWLPSRNAPGWIGHAISSTYRTVRIAHEADVIHAQAFQSVPPAAVARRLSGTPLVATFHTSHFLRRAQSRLWRPVLGALVRAPDRVLAASEEIARVAESLAPGTTVEAVTNAVDTRLFRPVEPTLPPAEGYRIVAPRRLFRKNGVEHLIRGLPLLRERLDRPVETVLVGDGPERGRLEALARELGVERAVRFLGARPHDEMPGLLCSADAAVFPSLMEATSVAALEAMACGVPVAASRVGGLPEIVDAGVGVLFEPADAEGLARAVAGLLSAKDREERGRRARTRVEERWGNERLVRRHLEVYEALRERSGSGRSVGARGATAGRERR